MACSCCEALETDDLLLAREKCKQAECDSELTSDGEKFNKSGKVRLVSFADSSEGEEAEDYINLKYPLPPRGKPSDKSRKDELSPNPLATVHRLAAETGDSDTRGAAQEFGCQSPSNSAIESNSSSPTPRLLLQKLNVDSPLSSGSPSATPTEKKLSAIDQINVSLGISLKKEFIAKYMADIQTEVKQIKATQNDILLRLSAVEPTKFALPDEIGLPLKSVEELNKVQTWLENEENKQKLINNLSFVGGNTTATITRRILQRVFCSPRHWHFSVTGVGKITSTAYKKYDFQK